MKTKSFPLLAVASLAMSSAVLFAADPALTIYNQNFAVVRDTVPLDLKAGVTDARFAGMTSMLEPDSVILRDPSGGTPFQILEQSYRNDPVTQELLLSLFEGQTLSFFVKEANKPDATVEGKVIRSGYKAGTPPVIETNGKLQFTLPGQPLFPSLGDDTVLNPTLTWKIQSAKDAKLEAELAYVTGGLSWSASYNLIAPENADLLDLVGWITIQNQSGKTFRNAKLKLMAGDVAKIQPPARMARREMAMAEPMAAGDVVTEKSFDEFHLYTVANKTTLRDQETKQVEFVRATGVKAARIYVYDGAKLPGWRAGMNMGAGNYGGTGNRKVDVYREFKNEAANKLGLPLPQGKMRLYQQDADRQVEFVGEDSIDHTPKDELIRLKTGSSFDLTGERKSTDLKVNEANRRAEETIEIKLRNHKKEQVEIRAVEHLYRWSNWEVRQKSAEFVKTDAQTIEFRVPLKPDEEKVITYQVFYTW